MFPVVLLDADVIHAMPICAAILDVRECDLFSVRWSEAIFEEARRSLINRGKNADKVDARLDAMRAAFPDADVVGFEVIIPTLSLPDCNDRHVLAAAIAGEADIIVTNNISDFPHEELRKYDLEAVTAETFGIDGILRGLKGAGAPVFAEALKNAL